MARFREAEAALRSTDLKQALYDEGGVLMDKVLVTLHGDEHRKRRTVESQIFRRNFFRHYESEVFPKLLEETLDQFLVTSEVDLKELGYRIMVHLSLAFAGIDRIDGTVEEADAQHRLLIQLGQAATIGQHKGDREPIRREIIHALDEFDARFFQPSRARRQELIDAFQRGELEETDLPRDILTILLLNAEQLPMADEMMVREVAFFYLAASHTSVHTIVHAVNELFTWYADKPEEALQLADDLPLLQRFVLESMRLHPSSPVAMRRAEAPVTLGDTEAATGERVIIDLQAANRDESVFGEDAAQFNPFRERPARINPAGLSFGGGMHVCLGLNLVAGTLLKPGQEFDPDNHQFGTITLIIAELLRRGMQPHPEKKPEKIAASERDAWQSYPVLFTGRGAAHV
jgi:cytochrome P450